MLIDAVLNILFLHSAFVKPSKESIDLAIEEYSSALFNCSNALEIRTAIFMNCTYYLPIYLMVETFEKYLQLNKTDFEIMRNYAEYIDILIPEWKEYANKLLTEAYFLERNKN